MMTISTVSIVPGPNSRQLSGMPVAKRTTFEIDPGFLVNVPMPTALPVPVAVPDNSLNEQEVVLPSVVVEALRLSPSASLVSLREAWADNQDQVEAGSFTSNLSRDTDCIWPDSNSTDSPGGSVGSLNTASSCSFLGFSQLDSIRSLSRDFSGTSLGSLNVNSNNRGNERCLDACDDGSSLFSWSSLGHSDLIGDSTFWDQVSPRGGGAVCDDSSSLSSRSLLASSDLRQDFSRHSLGGDGSVLCNSNGLSALCGNMFNLAPPLPPFNLFSEQLPPPQYHAG